MKAKKVMMTVLAAVSVLSMSANVMAAGSITNAVDTNKVTASTVTKKIVGDKTEIATEDVEYSCAMKSHFRKFGNQMSGSGNHLCKYTSLLA